MNNVEVCLVVAYRVICIICYLLLIAMVIWTFRKTQYDGISTGKDKLAKRREKRYMSDW